MTKQQATKKIEPTADTKPVGKILNLQQVADRLGRHRNTIANWIEYGLIPAVENPSGLRGIREDVLNDFYGANNKALKNGKVIERVSEEEFQ